MLHDVVFAPDITFAVVGDRYAIVALGLLRPAHDEPVIVMPKFPDHVPGNGAEDAIVSVGLASFVVTDAIVNP